jgi:hypothetical protein
METQTQYSDGKTAVATVFQSTSLHQQAIFPKENRYWGVGYEGKALRLPAAKGLAYIALLRHPTTDFHVLDLVSSILHHRCERWMHSRVRCRSHA